LPGTAGRKLVRRRGCSARDRAQHLLGFVLFQTSLKVRAELFELPKTDSLANFAHYVKVKVNVVVGVQDRSEEFSGGIEMAQVRARVAAAHGAAAGFVNRARVARVLRALRVGSTQSIMSMPSET
jgi:hypothetical protein